MAYDMESTMIEASSLSTVTAIAQNPPQHPGQSAQSLGRPLVLYIARVPGSRDVFLTPMKPREKMVTAEDVQSSLYYVHINCEDEQLAPQQQASPRPSMERVSQRSSQDYTVKRRPPPLPARSPQLATPPYPTNDPMPAFGGRPPSPPKPQYVARKPVRDQPPPPPPHLDLPEIPARRALPTPPDEDPRPTTLRQENLRLLRHSDHSDESNPYFRKYEPLPPTDENTGHAPGSLTLIRRSPATSEQWNVASIHDPPIQEISSSNLLTPGSARKTKRGGAPLYLDVMNPGYAQFIDKERPESRNSSSSHSTGSSDPPPEGTFRRRLYMPGSRYGEHGYGHRKLNSIDSTSSGGGSYAMSGSARSRALSDLTANSPASVDRRSKGYSFTSPWEGRCEFTTGATGKSLKCRHTVQVGGSQSTTEVSELRFNLPSTSKNTPNSEKRSSYFTRHSKLLTPGGGSGDFDDGSVTPSIVIGEDGRVDLSLGQEKAGGGFGGKQAKLGKMIIEPEGLKMLDLLVAANVGLWWRAYERV